MGSASGERFIAVYDNQDRLIRYNNSTYTYNANGDMIGRSDYKGCDFKSKKSVYDNTIIAYDVFGNLKQYGTVTYKIDPLNRRSHRLVNGVVTNQYVYNPDGKLIAELDKDGNLTKTFIYASKSHVPDYFVDNKNVKYKIVTDQLGSIRLVVNAQTGEVKEKMNHDEFGKVLTDSNPNYIPFGFAGGLYDSETKLVRFGARDYDSRIGRWTSKDPIRFNGGDSNLYGYVIQDPVDFIDPRGTDAVFYTILSGAIPHSVIAVSTPNQGVKYFEFGPSSPAGAFASLFGASVSGVNQSRPNGVADSIILNTSYYNLTPNQDATLINNLLKKQGSYNLYNNNCFNYTSSSCGGMCN